MLIELFLLAVLVGVCMIFAAAFQVMVRQRRARDRAHIRKRVTDLEEHRH